MYNETIYASSVCIPLAIVRKLSLVLGGMIVITLWHTDSDCYA